MERFTYQKQKIADQSGLTSTDLKMKNDGEQDGGENLGEGGRDDLDDSRLDCPHLGEILKELIPQKSTHAYEKCWSDFRAFCHTAGEPQEEDYLRYFHFLRKEKGLKGSSIWSMYSRLNSFHQRTFGTKLQKWPRITMLLKSFMSGYTRKTATKYSGIESKSMRAQE